MFVLIIVSIIGSLQLGSADMDWNLLWQNNSEYNVIFKYRLFRVLSALLVGVALPVSGMLLQEYFKNVLAGPSIMGISSSAGLGVALVLFLGFPLAVINTSIWANLGLAAAGLLGAFACMFVLFSLSKYLLDSSQFIIIGFLISALTSAIISILQLYGSNSEIKQYVIWSFGNLSGLSGLQLLVLFIFIIIGLVVGYVTLKLLQGNLLGEMYAQSVGVDLQKMKLGVLLSTSLLTGAITAFIGPIAFIGIIIPYFTRSYISNANLYRQFLFNILFGILLMLWLNVGAILTDWPINIIVSFIGIPLIAKIILQSPTS